MICQGLTNESFYNISIGGIKIDVVRVSKKICPSLEYQNYKSWNR